MHQHRAGGRETAIPATAIDYGYLNDRDNQMREAGAPSLVSKASVTVIAGLVRPSCQRKVQTSMPLLNLRTT